MGEVANRIRVCLEEIAGNGRADHARNRISLRHNKKVNISESASARRQPRCLGTPSSPLATSRSTWRFGPRDLQSCSHSCWLKSD